ncbi:hypothetical protein HQ38_02040 [Porphyromonas crevioricanis]|uniref:Uncharacterized protein n=1 Tax=Porphyromonas crevioricanis TaxID=393921 RepID=A0AB34PLH9_9PORP|nr:hypothetical protein HQ38_02040 [Porphyromonas crevioricanis]
MLLPESFIAFRQKLYCFLLEALLLLPESFIAFCRKLYCFCLKALLLFARSFIAFCRKLYCFFAKSLGALDVLIRSSPEKMLSDRQKDTE